MDVPIADNGLFWNGCPDKWSNLPKYGLDFSQKFAMRALDYSPMLGHNGVDIAGAMHTPIVLPMRAWISYTGNDGNGYGNFVFAETETVAENGGAYKLEMVFGHMSQIEVDPYRWREAGDLIGLMGSTGRSTGPHVHFGIRPFVRQKDGSFVQMFKDNGYRGYIDPELFIKQHLVWDRRELINKDNLDKFMTTNEKEIIIEGEGHGRKGIIINGKLRQIKEGREADACLYKLANVFVSTADFDNMPKDKDF